MSFVQPPSIFLPPLRGIKACPQHVISDSITQLRDIYLPQVRGSTRRRSQRSSSLLFNARPESAAGSRSIENNVESIRGDVFERSFSIQWLTRFISIYSELAQDGAKADLLAEATSLLAICAGSAAAGNILRTFSFPFNPRPKESNASGHVSRNKVGDHETNEIRLMLRDAPLDPDDFSSVGAHTWGGSCILAEMVVENPKDFGIPGTSEADGPSHIRSRPFRALELGAGTGLGSLVLAKVLERARGPAPGALVCSHPQTQPMPEREHDVVVATDFHPSVLANLKINVEANFPPEVAEVAADTTVREHVMSNSYPLARPARSLRVVVLPLDWSSIHALSHMPVPPHRHLHHPTNPSADPPDPSSKTPSQASGTPATTVILPSPLDTPFDLIIGADIIYESLHARWVRNCVEKFLRKPSADLSSPSAFPSIYAYTRIHTDYDSTAQPGSQSFSEPALFHLIIPLRRTHASESRTMGDVFAPAHEVVADRERGMRKASPVTTTHHSSPKDPVGAETHSPQTQHSLAFSTPPPPELAILSQEDIVCDAYSDKEEADEVIYRYYKIGWV